MVSRHGGPRGPPPPLGQQAAKEEPAPVEEPKPALSTMAAAVGEKLVEKVEAAKEEEPAPVEEPKPALSAMAAAVGEKLVEKVEEQ